MYRVQCSVSYFGILHNQVDDCATQHVRCAPLMKAFDLLITENFKSFILTITIYTVGIFKTKDGKFKVFDSHSRDSEGISDPFGTCLIIQVASLDKLVQYLEKIVRSIQRCTL